MFFDSILPWLAVIGILALAYGYGVVKAIIQIHFTHWTATSLRFERFDDDQVSPETAQIVAELTNIGFTARGHWRVLGFSHTTGQITLMEHPQTHTNVRFLVVAARKRHEVTVAVTTRFNDGTEILTANNQLTIGLPSPPEITQIWLPEIRDVRQMWHVHAQATEALGHNKKTLSIGPDGVDYLATESRRMQTYHVHTGYRYLDERNEAYRPTWKAAILSALRLLWPIRPLYRAWRRRPTRKLLKELGIDLRRST